MRRMMCKLWTNFAKHGDPTPDDDNPLTFKWKAVQPVSRDQNDIDLDYLALDDEPRIVQNINKHRMDFWRNIYRKWNTTPVASKL